MPVPVTIPRLGWNMDEGTFLEWVKADGDAVKPGEVLFRLEGEKATEEIESLDAGTLHIPVTGPHPGERLTVGSVIGYLLRPGESPPAGSAQEASVGAFAPRRAVAGEHEGSLQLQVEKTRASITPRARRLADRLGLDTSQIQGSGRGGRVRECDVAVAGVSAPRVEPLTPIRRAIAARMVESRQSTTPVTLMSVADASRLVAVRASLKQAGGSAPSVTDLFVKLTAAALAEHPLLASRFSDAGIVPARQIDIGIAVDTDAGLLVPVIRDVPSLTLREVAAQSRDLIDRARGGKLAATEMRGGCFTVTNLGAHGIDAFTPVINFPECAVLGLGRIAQQPVMDNDRVVGRERVTLCLTFDHRIVDGGPAARFLQTLVRLVENPEEWGRS